MDAGGDARVARSRGRGVANSPSARARGAFSALCALLMLGVFGARRVDASASASVESEQIENERARLPLLYAAGEGDAAAVREILSRNPAACEEERSAHGETPLHTAAILAEPEVLDALLRAGCDVNARTLGGTTLRMSVLHWMAYGGSEKHAAGLEKLLAKGADANARNTKGETPWDLVSQMPEGEYRDRALALLEASNGASGLHSEF